MCVYVGLHASVSVQIELSNKTTYTRYADTQRKFHKLGGRTGINVMLLIRCLHLRQSPL